MSKIRVTAAMFQMPFGIIGDFDEKSDAVFRLLELFICCGPSDSFFDDFGTDTKGVNSNVNPIVGILE